MYGSHEEDTQAFKRLRVANVITILIALAIIIYSIYRKDVIMPSLSPQVLLYAPLFAINLSAVLILINATKGLLVSFDVGYISLIRFMTNNVKVASICFFTLVAMTIYKILYAASNSEQPIATNNPALSIPDVTTMMITALSFILFTLVVNIIVGTSHSHEKTTKSGRA